MSKEELIKKYLQEHSELKAKFVYEEDVADIMEIYGEQMVNEVLDKVIQLIQKASPDEDAPVTTGDVLEYLELKIEALKILKEEEE